jgi:two-component system, NtrC family, response regulator HydG
MGFLLDAPDGAPQAATSEGCWLEAAWNRESAVDASCTRVLAGLDVSDAERRLLASAVGTEVQWGRVVGAAFCLAKVQLAAGRNSAAALTLAHAGVPYSRLARLARRGGVVSKSLNRVLSLADRVAASIRPGTGTTSSPFAVLRRLALQLKRNRAPSPQPTIDALDAFAVMGAIAHDGTGDEQLARELARMLGGRVLLHYDRGVYRTKEAQAVHTLSMWTIRQLVAAEGFRVWSVRKRPEFWRPEQRRPRGLLRVPLGGGCVVIARGRRFRSTERKAVQAVLRFFALRRTTPPDLPVPRQPGPDGAEPKPTVAEGLVGRAPAWRTVLAQVQRVAPTTCSVVLHGETGTGKERLARALHACSSRSQRPFVAVNCGALAPELVASELFGHVRGAFTGADRSREGLFAAAHTGTLFLDEVGDMPASVQTALLRVLETREITPVGSAHSRVVDVRVVCATHRDLEREVRAGRFREDLWHRLNVVTIELPPLRDRLVDLPLLAAHVLARVPGEHRLHPDASEVLARYRWPGNVRELENVLRATTLLSDQVVLTPDLLERVLESRRAARAEPAVPVPPRTAALLQALGERWCSTADLSRSLGVSPRTLNREMVPLLERGLVQQSGRAKAVRYRRDERAWRDLSRSAGDLPTRAAFSPSPRAQD